MPHHRNEALEERVARLERSLRRARAGGALLLLAVVASAFSNGRAEVLRAQALILEDARGRPRLLLGAPIPEVEGRRRKDAATGLVLLGEDGADRIQLGHVGGPQMGGVVQSRISPATMPHDQAPTSSSPRCMIAG